MHDVTSQNSPQNRYKKYKVKYSWPTFVFGVLLALLFPLCWHFPTLEETNGEAIIKLLCV